MVLILLIVFVTPWAAAWWIYHQQPGLVTRGAAAAGVLLDPPVSMAGWLPVAPAQHSRWTILQVEPARCAAACVGRLTATRQVRALMHRKAADVDRVLLLPDGAEYSALQPDDVIVRRNAQWQQRLASDVGGIDESKVYLVGPEGLAILAYPDFIHGERLRQDLARLLSLTGDSG